MSNPQFPPEDILNCAREIRFFLPSLLGSDAAQVDQQLADLLAQNQTEKLVDAQILELLKSNPSTFQWMKEYLSSEQVSKGFERLPGSGGTVSAQKYICPQGDYFWYRRSAGIPIPTCPTHGEIIPVEAD